MAEGSTPVRQDWMIPATLVTVVVVIALIIAVVVGVRSADSRDDSIAGQLERWTSCLRSEGANVPLVESVRDGGFRVTVDGSLLEEGLDRDALRPAIDACSEEAPERLRRIMSLFDSIPKTLLGDMEFGNFEFYGAENLSPEQEGEHGRSA